MCFLSAQRWECPLLSMEEMRSHESHNSYDPIVRIQRTKMWAILKSELIVNFFTRSPFASFVFLFRFIVNISIDAIGRKTMRNFYCIFREIGYFRSRSPILPRRRKWAISRQRSPALVMFDGRQTACMQWRFFCEHERVLCSSTYAKYQPPTVRCVSVPRAPCKECIFFSFWMPAPIRSRCMNVLFHLVWARHKNTICFARARLNAIHIRLAHIDCEIFSMHITDWWARAIVSLCFSFYFCFYFLTSCFSPFYFSFVFRRHMHGNAYAMHTSHIRRMVYTSVFFFFFGSNENVSE